MFEQKKKMSNAKFFALVVSVGLHVVLFIYLGKMALDFALPKGEVTSYEMEFSKENAPATPVDVVQEKVEAPTPPPPPAAKPPPVPKVVEKKTPPMPKALPQPKSLPTKETSDVEDKQGELPVATEVAEKVEAPEETLEEPTPAVEPPTESVAEAVPQAVPPTEAPVAQEPAAPATPSAGPAPTMGAAEGVQSDAVLVPFGSNKPISYPTMARFRKLEGETIVHYSVSGSGEVTEVKVMQSSGFPILDNQAVDTIKNWKFKPTGKDGVYERPIRYSLKGDAKEAPSQLRRTGK